MTKLLACFVLGLAAGHCLTIPGYLWLSLVLIGALLALIGTAKQNEAGRAKTVEDVIWRMR